MIKPIIFNKESLAVVIPIVSVMLILLLGRIMSRNSFKQIRLEKEVKREESLFKKNNDYESLLRLEVAIDRLIAFFEVFYNLNIADLFSHEPIEKYHKIAQKDIGPWYFRKMAVVMYKRGDITLDDLLQKLA